ncbi:CoA-binding protein [Microbacterium ulmi]|uniref:CoA-binding protein n=1 Tax=Microbacterium ulmi TaxID=179095 RepID=A0A7Y2M1U8_9MICO|nr:CoA-binding protein [Microbacterium ulmi]NII68622.1 hypothetical protein [Microbacterium ulmi]NNH04792.1 CoA-binding protein [Microbacterium ulmi]
MNDSELASLLESSQTVAIVGLSTDPAKPSQAIARILLDAGFDVIPVHPTAGEIMGLTAYRSLSDIPVPIDVVDVFRPSGETPRIAEQAVAVGAKTLWLQLGIASAEARTIAESAGLQVVEDTCIGATTRRLGVRSAGAATV